MNFFDSRLGEKIPKRYQRVCLVIKLRTKTAIFYKTSKQNIEEKKLQDQMVFTNQAAARAAKEEAELKKIVQEAMGVVVEKVLTND